MACTPIQDNLLARVPGHDSDGFSKRPNERFAARLAAAVLLAGCAFSAVSADATARTFYVHFGAGSDAADGLTPATAWKRAPGDTLASGKAAAMKLQPGDTVLFAGGVRYRGSIFLRQSGTRDAPIVFDGSGWGSMRAVMDGSDALPNAQPCRSAADCLGSPHWAKLMRTTVPAGAIWSDWLFDADKAMQISQWPTLQNFWDYDNVAKLATIPKATLPQLTGGRIAVPGIPQGLAAGSPTLALWTMPNELTYSTSFQMDSGGISFVQPKFKPYPDRDNKFAIMNSPMQVDGPGKFAISGKHGVAIVWPSVPNGMPRLSLGSKRYGFLMARVSHVRIRGFSFANFVGDTPEAKPNFQAGVPINNTTGSEGLQILDNRFVSIVNMNKQAAINMSRAGATQVSSNSFSWMPMGTAMTFSQSPGPVRVACNLISDVGRNGVRFISVFRGDIIGNRIERLHGIHGAGINLYHDNRLITVRDNVVLDANYPMTMHGEPGAMFFGTDATPPAVRISGNVMTSSNRAAGAISSWGNNLKNVTISGNTLTNPLYAIRFYGSETGMLVEGNKLVGQILIPKTTQVTAQGNQIFDPQGNGILVAQQAASSSVPGQACS